MAVIDARVQNMPALQSDAADTSALSRGAGALAAGVRNSALQALTEIETRDTAAAGAALANARVEMQARFDEYTRNPSNDINDENYTANFLTGADTELERFRTGMSTRAGNTAIDALKNNLLSEYALKMDAHRTQAVGEQAKLNMLTILNANGNYLMANPEAFVPVMEEQTLLLSLNPNLTDEQKFEFSSMMREQLATAAIQGIALNNPGQAVEELMHGDWDVWLTPPQKSAMVTSFMGKVISNQKEAERKAKEAAKIASDNLIKEIMTMDEEGKLTPGFVKMYENVLSPEHYKLALKLSNTTDPEVDDAQAVLALQSAVQTDPGAVAGLVLHYLGSGQIKGSTARTYSDEAFGRMRSEGYKGPMKEALESWDDMTKPQMMDKFDARKAALTVRGREELQDRLLAEGGNLTRAKAREILRSVIMKWSKPADAIAWSTAPDSTNRAAMERKMQTIHQQAGEIQARYESGEDEALQTPEQLRAMLEPLRRSYQEMHTQLKAMGVE